MSDDGKPELFIIESLGFDDEHADRFEGQIIKKILSLSGKKCEYYYIRTKRELSKVLKLFKASRYRYLHLSCHGNEETMATTLDSIPFPELSELLRPYLPDRRLFVSACSMTNDDLAKLIMPNSGCYSMIGPDVEIAFSDAAILWASLYHVMFTADTASMKGEVLRAKAQEVSNMYRVSLKYFGRDRSVKKGYVGFEIRPKLQDYI